MIPHVTKNVRAETKTFIFIFAESLKSLTVEETAIYYIVIAENVQHDFCKMTTSRERKKYNGSQTTTIVIWLCREISHLVSLRLVSKIR